MRKILSFNLNDKFALVAKTKSGKSYLGKIIQRVYPRKIIIDNANEYTPDQGKIVYGFPAFAAEIKNITDFGIDNYSIIFRFNLEEKNDEAVFEEICRIVFYLGDTLFVVEEVHILSSPHSINYWFMKIATMGSHQNIALMLTTQRPALLNKTLLTQCDHIFIGALIDENDISYVKGFLRDYAKSIHSFEARKFVYWTHGNITIVDTNNLK